MPQAGMGGGGQSLMPLALKAQQTLEFLEGVCKNAEFQASPPGVFSIESVFQEGKDFFSV